MSAGLRHTRKVIRVSLLFLVVTLGCGHPAKATDHTPPSPVAVADDPSCPLLVAGTTVSVEDADQGVALVFVTTGDAADVRKRAATLAEMHNAHHAKMSDPHAAMDHGGGGAMGTMFSTHSTAAVSDVQGGARVTFTAASPDTVSALQSEVRMHAQHLAGASSCEMKM
jgi:hypothetical protein